MATVLADHTRTLDLVESDGIVVSLTRLFRVINVAGTDYKVLTTALATGGVPVYGDKLTTPASLANLIVTDRRAELVDSDNGTVDVTVTYERFSNDGQDLDSPPVGQFIPQGRSTLQQVTSNLDREGGVIEVSHTWPPSHDRYAQFKSNGGTETQGGEVSYAQPQRTVVVRGRKGTNRPWLIQAAIEGKTNVSAWLGGAVDQWLCTSVEWVTADVSGATSQWFFTFEFTYNPDGWQPFVTFKDPETNKPPQNLEAGVGYKQVNRYEQANFESIIGQRIHG